MRFQSLLLQALAIFATFKTSSAVQKEKSAEQNNETISETCDGASDRITILRDPAGLMSYLESKPSTTEPDIAIDQDIGIARDQVVSIQSKNKDKECVDEQLWMKMTQKWALMDLFEGLYVTADQDTSDECQWKGVICTNGIVTRLELSKLL